MSSPNSKRSSRPASELSTADIYGEKHGIPSDVQVALQNVARRNRQAVSMGRPLVPTQSLPAFNSPHFMTERDTYRAAQGIISKEALRAREIQPYAATVDALDLAPGPREDRRLDFTPDGEVRELSEHERERGTKRPGEEPDGFDTQLMPPPPLPRTTRGLPARGFSKTVSAPVGRLGTYAGMEIDPITGSAGFSNWARPSPETGNANAVGAAGAPVRGPAPAPLGAGAGPVAAPFTAGFGGFSPATSFAAPKEEDEEDGFDVGEWAASEQF